MPIAIRTATIAAGQSITPSINCTGGIVTMLGIPIDWTGATVSFQVSGDGNAFFDLFDKSAEELVMHVVPGTAVLFDQSISGSILYLKIRSGTRIIPFVQMAAKTLTVVTA